MKLLTIVNDNNECEKKLQNPRGTAVCCCMTEYCDEEIAELQKEADKYILIQQYICSDRNGYTNEYCKSDLNPEKFVVKDGELNGFFINLSCGSFFLPLNRSGSIGFNWGWDHTTSSGSEKWFLLRRGEVDCEIPDVISYKDELYEIIEKLYKRIY